MPPQKSRSAAFDVARALAALFIVGFHHVLDYSPFLKGKVDLVLDDGIKIGCLAFFFFCSAYLVSRHTEIRRIEDAVRFWKRRCVRLVPLYLLALLSFSRPFRLTVLSVFGLNNFVPGIDGRNIATLWFVSQLILYYLLYPFLRTIKRKSVLVATCLALEAVFWRGSDLWGWDHRLWLYFPLYTAGVLAADRTEQEIAAVSFPLGAGFIALAAVGLLSDFPVVTAFCGCGLVFAVSVLLAKVKPLAPLFGAVSYASMCAYLFHRKEYYRLVSGLIRWTDPAIRDRPVFLLWMYLAFVPAVFVAGWFVQRTYDILVRKASRRASSNATQTEKDPPATSR